MTFENVSNFQAAKNHIRYQRRVKTAHTSNADIVVFLISDHAETRDLIKRALNYGAI